jgi:integrase
VVAYREMCAGNQMVIKWEAVTVLTKSIIDKLKGPTQKGDHIIPGMAVKVTKEGKKTFVLRYAFRGDRLQKKLGDYGVFTLEQARDLAREKLILLAKGEDPFPEQGESGGHGTWAEFWPLYQRLYGSSKKSFELEVSLFNRYILPNFGSKPIAETTHMDVVRLKMMMKPVAFNRIRSLISVIWQAAIEHQLVPITTVRPTLSVKRNPEQPRRRRLSPEETIRLLKAVEAYHDRSIQVVIWLYLVTACRPSEILRLKWSLIDFENHTITVEDTKNGTDHTLPVHPYALTLINSLPRSPEAIYLFPSRHRKKNGKHRTRISLRVHWARLKDVAGITNLTLHDLRRSVGSMMRRGGVPIDIIAKIHNHLDSHVTERVYADLSNVDNRKVKEAIYQHTEQLLGLLDEVKKNEPEPVLP